MEEAPIYPALESFYTISGIPYVKFFSLVSKCADLPGFEESIVGAILAFAQLTGWSAELISKKIEQHFNFFIDPEKVWDIFNAWNTVQSQKAAAPNTYEGINRADEMMLRILRRYGYRPGPLAKSLIDTPRPTNFKFDTIWHRTRPSTISGFKGEDRNRSIGYLSWHSQDDALAAPTPTEMTVLEVLGTHTARIIRRILPLWLDSIRGVEPHMPFTKSISDYPEHFNFIWHHLRLFRILWEATFGIMDDQQQMEISVPIFDGDIAVPIKSTGVGGMWFLCGMLNDRVIALDARRVALRQETCFRKVSIDELPEDIKDCSICQLPFGTSDDDGVVEMPIQVVACCGNYFGINCLRTWYGNFLKGQCPLCKWTATSLFVEKLCVESEDIYGAIMASAEETISRLVESELVYFTTGEVEESST